MNVSNFIWKLSKDGDYYILKVEGLTSEAEGIDYFYRLCSAFDWLLLQKHIPVKMELRLDNIHYASDPEKTARHFEQTMGLLYIGPIDGMASGNSPTLYPNDKHIRFVTFGSATLTVGTPVSATLETLTAGMNIRQSNHTINDHKLRLAIDLYAAFFSESTDAARLITLVMVLEALRTDLPNNQMIIELIGKWQQEIEGLEKQHQNNVEQYKALLSLRNQMEFHKKMSLRRQLKDLVDHSLKYLMHPARDKLTAQVGKIYDLRSRLVHGDKVDVSILSEAVSNARIMVSAVLEARFKGFNSNVHL
jgi:hypothetical protein